MVPRSACGEPHGSLGGGELVRVGDAFGGMSAPAGRRRQFEIEEFVLEFRRSGLTQKGFAWHERVRPLGVAR